MSRRRRSYEAGHRPKVLIIIDGSPESAVAIRYAGRRAARTGAGLVMLTVVDPPEALPILGISSVMEDEAVADAQEKIEAASSRLKETTGVEAQTEIRIGKKADEIRTLIDTDEDIASLILAAGTGKDGPGPLVASMATKGASNLPVPIIIVPGDLTAEEIDALA
ncbi:MAG: universal stress protein [Beijerinckiaceae bacterium]